MIVCCATDNGKDFTDSHFGDAKLYLIYHVSKNGAHYLSKFRNSSVDETRHADPKKAKSIVSLLKDHKVAVSLTKVYGPNIKRIRHHLLPVLTEETNIDQALKTFVESYDQIDHLLDQENIHYHLEKNKIYS